MAKLYGMARTVWRCVPRPVRVVVGRSRPMHWLRRAAVGLGTHEEIYSEQYYASRNAAQSHDAISAIIMRELAPSSVLDVGCGTGELLANLREAGVTVAGLEYSEAALVICRDKQLDVRKFDLERDDGGDVGSFDVVVSTEVAEHLPASCADRYVDLLSAAGDTIVFTAATPGQGGTDHVNEQPHAYWVDKFRARDLDLDADASERWRADLEAGGAESWYYRNMMVFRRGLKPEGLRD